MAEDDDLGFDDELEAAPTDERLHPILTNEEVAKAKASARDKVQAEQRKAALKQVEAEETVRLRREEGLTTGIGVKDEIVSLTIDLPPFAACLRVDFDREFHHGHTYQVPRHVADSLREMMDREWKHEDEVKGRSLSEHYGAARNVKLNGVTGAKTEAPKVVYAS